MRFSDMENSRVGIIGAGREGQAVWRQVRRRFPGKPLSLFSESPISEAFQKQLDPALDAFHSGPLDVNTLKDFDLLVRSAGVSIYRDELIELRTLGVPFTTASNLWFAENPKARTICISGTLGKSTTAKLTAHLLKQAGLRTCLAGNIGRPMLDCENEAVDWWVIELSSYQIADLEAKPDIALLLNFSEEHLDWHRGIENYRADKLRLAQLASNGRVIANFSDEVLKQGLKNDPGITWFNMIGHWQAGKDFVYRQMRQSDPPGLVHSQVCGPASLPGAHNMQNLAAALTVVQVLDLQIPRLHEALFSFSGLPHRLQFVGEKSGVIYINDSISTTPVSVMAALQTFNNDGVVLLLGGMDRGLDWSDFARRMLEQAPYAIVALPDNGPGIIGKLKAAGVRPEGGFHTVTGLKEAVLQAEKLVPENGCILLSPGAPSFPHFRDFEDRGEQFRKFSGF
ncbi:MAG: UDP-N-acetylmuramoyl-L-alanine--D-glutamate ligase [Lysobacterales bacterium]